MAGIIALAAGFIPAFPYARRGCAGAGDSQDGDKRHPNRR